jgi:site-specific recombinase XerD
MEQDHLIEFKEFLKNTKGLSIKTIADYSYWIKDLDPAMLSQEYINAYVQKKGNNSGIRGAIERFLEMTGLSKTFDMPPKQTGRTKKRIVREISANDIKIVSEHLYSQSFKKGLIFDMMCQGALRRIEATSIKLNSFKWIEWMDDITKFCQLIVIGKGNKERVVLINPETAEKIFNHYLAKYKFENIEQIRTFANSPSLLFTNDGNKISTWFVWNVIHSGSKQILGRDIRPHELRHARATELEKMGVPIRDIKNYLGHSSLATTEIYLHRSEKESIETIEKFLQKKS